MNTTEILDELHDNGPKQRHGCVTAWLIFMMIANGIVALAYLLASDEMALAIGANSTEGPYIILLGLVGLANIALAVMLLKWKKMAFYGFIGTTTVSFLLNLVLGLGVGQSIMGFIGIAVLYGILQITKNGRSAWSQME